MALEHAILVSLSEQEGSGYELARRFDRSIGHFWKATHQQIYKVLARMEASGLVSVELVHQANRPDKKVYRVTDTGREELSRWVQEPTEEEFGRSDLAVKLRGAAPEDLPHVVEEFRRHRDRHADLLDFYLANEKREFPNPETLTGRRQQQYLVLRAGISLERGLIEWCDEVLAALAPRTTTKQPNTKKPTSKDSDR